MIKRSIVLFSFAILCANICLAQVNSSQSLTNCTDALHCGRLSISLTSSVVAIHSTIAFNEKLENSSTNVIALNLSPSPRYFLTGSSGKTFQLKVASAPNATIVSNKKHVTSLNPGESHEWSVPLDINNDIELGEYEIRAAQSILVIAPRDYQLLHTTNGAPTLKRPLSALNGEIYELVSNPLKIKIVK